MHERYTEFERRRGRNGNRQRGAREFEQREDRDDRDFRSETEESRDDERGRREAQSFGGSEWRDRFAGSEWEQPRYVGEDFESRRRPFAGGHGGYGERSAPRYEENRFGGESFGARGAFGPAGPYGEAGQGSWGGFGQQPQQQGRHAGKGPKGYRRADDRILEDVNHALERHPDIDASEIEVTCQNGEIVLRGTVEDRHAKRLAEQCVEDLPGVKDVRNELRVQGQQGQQGQQQPRGAKGESAPRT